MGRWPKDRAVMGLLLVCLAAPPAQHAAAATAQALHAPAAQPPGVPAAQWAQYEAEEPKSILELQPFRSEAHLEVSGEVAGTGTVTLTNLNPNVDTWFLLTFDWRGRADRTAFHLENPDPGHQRPQLSPEQPDGVGITGLAGRESCVLWQGGSRSALEQAAASGLPYAPLCGGRLYLRNPVAGHRTSVEEVTEFLRDYVYGGEEIISFVKAQIYRDRFLEHGASSSGSCSAPASSSSGAPQPAATGTACIVPGSLGIDLDAESAGLMAGAWYAVRDLPDVYVSTLTPEDLSSELYSGSEPGVNRLDGVESAALVYLVAFDLSSFDLHFALGTDHPRLDWSPRPPAAVRDSSLPGPDGVATAAPLVTDGMVSPADVDRTVAAFAGGFKREHGAFRYGPFALENHGSHYGFVQQGTIFSKLQPGLATLFALSDGRVEMKTWTRADDAMLGSIRDARQNGLPLIVFDPARGVGVPGALVNQCGPGNWSGSADEVLRTVRAGACLQQAGSRRFLVYAYFSAATPSAVARVFEGYHCQYAMQLDINALEHTYLALYVRRDRERVVEHVVQGMDQCDSRTREGLAPRFLAVPDDRDFFYLTRRGSPP
jgi:hypothetical protein